MDKPEQQDERMKDAQDQATEIEVTEDVELSGGDAPEQVEQSTTRRADVASLLGVITGLMMESQTHRHLFIADLNWLVVPPLRLKQFRLFKRGNLPVAYVSWAKLTEEAEQRLKSGQVRLQPNEWNAGDRLWLIDLVAPFGGDEEIVGGLKKSALGGQSIKMLRQTSNDSGSIVISV